MKIRFILRDGSRVLQQSDRKCPVLHRDVWEDVPLVVETDELRPITTCSNASTEKSCGHIKTSKEEDRKLIDQVYRAGAEQAKKNAAWFNRIRSNHADSDVSEP